MARSALLRKNRPAKIAGEGSSRAIGRHRSMFAGSSFQTSLPTTATRSFWPDPPNAPRRYGPSFSRTSRTSRRRAFSRSTRRRRRRCWRTNPAISTRRNEMIVGLQTDQPFKRAIFPYGGLQMVEAGLRRRLASRPIRRSHEAFTKYRKTHNDGVFDAYTPEIMRCRRSGIITGLPDAYGRGRIIGDYRRVALYGVARLIEVKKEERAQINDMWPTDEIIRHARRAGGADPCAERPRRDGQALRLRHQHGRPRMPTKPCNGPISPISAPSRRRTAPRCRSGASRRSSISTSSAT